MAGSLARQVQRDLNSFQVRYGNMVLEDVETNGSRERGRVPTADTLTSIQARMTRLGVRCRYYGGDKSAPTCTFEDGCEENEGCSLPRNSPASMA